MITVEPLYIGHIETSVLNIEVNLYMKCMNGTKFSVLTTEASFL